MSDFDKSSLVLCRARRPRRTFLIQAPTHFQGGFSRTEKKVDKCVESRHLVNEMLRRIDDLPNGGLPWTVVKSLSYLNRLSLSFQTSSAADQQRVRSAADQKMAMIIRRMPPSRITLEALRRYVIKGDVGGHAVNDGWSDDYIREAVVAETDSRRRLLEQASLRMQQMIAQLPHGRCSDIGFLAKHFLYITLPDRKMQTAIRCAAKRKLIAILNYIRAHELDIDIELLVDHPDSDIRNHPLVANHSAFVAPSSESFSSSFLRKREQKIA